MYTHRIAALLSLVLVGAACSKAADDEAKAEKAQAVAADKLTAATVEANQKMAAAQTEADLKVAEARASFMKRRENYRHDVTVRLGALDEKIGTMMANDRSATGKSRADLDAKLPQIHAYRDALNQDYQVLDGASAATWDDAKKQFDRDLDALESAMK